MNKSTSQNHLHASIGVSKMVQAHLISLALNQAKPKVPPSYARRRVNTTSRADLDNREVKRSMHRRCLGLLGLLATAALTVSCGLFEPDPSTPRAPAFEEQIPSNAVPVKVNPEGPSLEQRVLHASTHAFVAWFGVGAPLGRIVLMRRGADICAIRFTAFHTRDETPPGAFTLGGTSYYAEYDWYHLTGPRKKSGHREASEKPGYGIPLLTPPIFFAGDRFIKCGSMEPLWSYPIAVRFYETNEVRRDFGIELAPTGWNHADEIDLTHPALRWYRVNEKRDPFLLPLELLPQSASNRSS